jgi:hypothetical protein
LISPQIYLSSITAIITATATLLAVYLTNKGNTSRLLLQLEEERKTKSSILLREKLEELYLLASKYATSLAAYYLPYLSVMKGELEYNQALEMTIERGRKESPDFDRLQMLIELYFPSLSKSLNQLIENRDKANDILFAHKAEYKKGNRNNQEFLEQMLAALKQINQSSNTFKSSIILQEKKIE